MHSLLDRNDAAVRHHPRLAIAAASAAALVLSIGMPLGVLNIYDRVLPNAAWGTLWALGGLLCIVVALDALTRWARGELIVADARCDERAHCRQLGNYLLFGPLRPILAEAPAVQLGRLRAIETLRSAATGAGSTLYFDLLIAVATWSLLGLIGGRLMLVPIAVIAAVLVLSGILAWLIRTNLVERNAADGRRRSFLAELFDSMQDIKGLALEPLMQRRYERLLGDNVVHNQRQLFATTLLKSLGELLGYVTLIATAGTAAFMVQAGNLSLGELAACTLLAGRTVQPTLSAMSTWSRRQSDHAARMTLKGVHAGGIGPSAAVETESTCTRFRVEALTLSSRPTAPTIDFELTPGRCVGLTGATGTGKTHLLHVLGGVAEPATGRVLVDDRPLDAASHHQLGTSIGVVTACPPLLHGTILENLTLFGTVALDARARHLIETLGIDNAVARLADGYATVVGRGHGRDGISLDLRVRTGIARVLAMRPTILLIDEVNRWLDHDGDACFAAALRHVLADTAVLLVAQRPSILALADQVYRLDWTTFQMVEQSSPARSDRSQELVS